MQVCNFCNNPESILTRETCCSGCSKINDAYQPKRSKREDSICSLCKENYKRLDDDLCEGCRSGEQINQLIFGN